MGEPTYSVAWHGDAPDPSALCAPASKPLPERVDWVVIGGGYAGLAAARRAAASGARVLLLEGGRLRDGASSRNGGMVHVGFGAATSALVRDFGHEGAREWIDLSRAAVRRIAELCSAESTGLAAVTGVDPQWSPTGHLELARAPRGAAALEVEAELRSSLGIPVRLHDRTHTSEIACSDRFAGSLAVLEGGGVQPARFHAALATAAVASGVDVRENVRVTGVLRGAGAMIVETTAGRIRTEHVFAGVNGLADGAFPSLRRRLIPVGSYMIATERLDPALLAATAGAGEMRFDTRNFLSYWRPTPDGRIAFGGRTSFWPDSMARIAAALTARLKEIHPQLSATSITHAWGGRLAFTLDRLPRVARIDGVTHVAGCAGSGVALMTHLAELAIDWDLGGDTPLPARRAWSPIPIPYEGRPWFLPLAGIGFAMQDRWEER